MNREPSTEIGAALRQSGVHARPASGVFARRASDAGAVGVRASSAALKTAAAAVPVELPAVRPTLLKFAAAGLVVAAVAAAALLFITLDNYFQDQAGSIDVAKQAVREDFALTPITFEDVAIQDVQRTDYVLNELTAYGAKLDRYLKDGRVADIKYLLKQAAELKERQQSRPQDPWLPAHERAHAEFLLRARTAATDFEWAPVSALVVAATEDLQRQGRQGRLPRARYLEVCRALDKYLRTYQEPEYQSLAPVVTAHRHIATMLTSFWEQDMQPEARLREKSGDLKGAVEVLERDYVGPFAEHAAEVLSVDQARKELERLQDRLVPWVELLADGAARDPFESGPPKKPTEGLINFGAGLGLGVEDYYRLFRKKCQNAIKKGVLEIECEPLISLMGPEYIDYFLRLPVPEQVTDFSVRLYFRRLEGFSHLYVGKIAEVGDDWQPGYMQRLGLTAAELRGAAKPHPDAWSGLLVTHRNRTLTYQVLGENRRVKTFTREARPDDATDGLFFIAPLRLGIMVSGYGSIEIQQIVYKDFSGR